MINKLLWSLIAVFSILNLYYVNITIKNRTIIKELRDSNYQLVQQLKFVKENRYLKMQNRNVEVSPNTIVLKENGEEISFKVLLEERTKLFLYIPPFSCTSCYEKIIQNMSKLDSLYCGDSIIIIATYDNINSLNNFKRVNQIEQLVYNLKGEILPQYNDEVQKPCFIEMSGDGKIKSLQIIDMNYFELVYEYLDAL